MPSIDDRLVRYTLDLPASLHRRMRMKALEEGRHASAICREVLEAYLRDNDDRETARLKAAYEAGVRAERTRIADAIGRDGTTRPGLPTQLPRQTRP